MFFNPIIILIYYIDRIMNKYYELEYNKEYNSKDLSSKISCENMSLLSKNYTDKQRLIFDNNINIELCKNYHNNFFHPKIKNIWVKSDKGDFLNSIRPKEKGYYDSKFLGWELGVIKKEYCFWCGRIIEETRKNDPRSETVKFCNQTHRKAFGKVKADQEKLGKLFASK